MGRKIIKGIVLFLNLLFVIGICYFIFAFDLLYPIASIASICSFIILMRLLTKIDTLERIMELYTKISSFKGDK